MARWHGGEPQRSIPTAGTAIARASGVIWTASAGAITRSPATADVLINVPEADSALYRVTRGRNWVPRRQIFSITLDAGKANAQKASAAELGDLSSAAPFRNWRESLAGLPARPRTQRHH